MVKVGFVGFGLMAGSIAHALIDCNNNFGKDYVIVATSRHLEPVRKAKEEGVVNIVADSLDSTFSDCDLILLSTPVITITEYLQKLKGIVKPDCIISDIGSVKEIIHNAAHNLDLDEQFVGGHPMAGSEKTGYDNSSSDIIRGAKFIITPTEKTTDDKIEFMKTFALDINMKPLVMDYKTHDKTVAAVSHVPHLISTALVHVVADNDDADNHMQLLAAGSFRDMTRVAASSPEMWEQICMTNPDAICDILDQYISKLEEIKSNIKDQKNGYVQGLFEMSRDYRNSFVKKIPQ